MTATIDTYPRVPVLVAIGALLGDYHPADAMRNRASPTFRAYCRLMETTGVTPAEILAAAMAEHRAEPERMAHHSLRTWLKQDARYYLLALRVPDEGRDV